jgi:ribonuclease P protein component
MPFAIPRNIKLKSRKSIETLFTSGKAVRKGAVRAVYSPINNAGNTQVGFSVSKRFFKKAVDRNRVKRVMREAYRLNQQVLESQEATHLNIMFIYQSNKLPDFKVLNELFPKILKELNSKCLLTATDSSTVDDRPLKTD